MKMPSLRELIEGDPYFNRNRARMTPRLVYIFVEGPDDVRLFASLLNPEVCDVNACQGKPAVLLEARRCKNIANVLAIVDADYSPLTKKDFPYPDNVFSTDTHDVETMIAASEAMQKVIDNYADARKLAAFKEKYGIGIVEAVDRIARPLGYLRWLNEHEGLNLNFKRLAFEKVIRTDRWELDEPELLELILAQSSRADLPAALLDDKWRRFRHEHQDTDRWLVSHGHDVANILLLIMRKHIGRRAIRWESQQEVEASLRLAYEQIHFMTTRLYRALKAWEQALGGRYQVLKPIPLY